jgi:hypothetical protein
MRKLKTHDNKPMNQAGPVKEKNIEGRKNIERDSLIPGRVYAKSGKSEVRNKSVTMMNAIMKKRADVIYIVFQRSQPNERKKKKLGHYAQLSVTRPATAFHTLLRLECVLTPMRMASNAMIPNPTAN